MEAQRGKARPFEQTNQLFHNAGGSLREVSALAGKAFQVAGVARGRGAPRLYWMTTTDNTTARLLYDRLAKHTGFIRYEYPPLA